MSVYQYAKSTDPQVIRITLANRDGRNELMRRATAWAQERGCKSALYSAFAGRYSVAGLPTKPEGRGRWTETRNAWRPFKNNRAEHEVMAALTFSNETVPGLPTVVMGKMNYDWSRPMMSPKPFVWEGAAYVGLSSAPDPDDQENRQGYGPQWVEILPSEFFTADEAVTGKTVLS